MKPSDGWQSGPGWCKTYEESSITNVLFFSQAPFTGHLPSSNSGKCPAPNIINEYSDFTHLEMLSSAPVNSHINNKGYSQCLNIRKQSIRIC